MVFLATSSYEGISGDGIQLENGTAELGSRLLITGTVDLSSEGNPQADNGDHFLLEDSSDVNVGQSVTINSFTSIANDNLVDETDGDNLILENPVGFQGGGTFKQEDGTTVTGTFGDDILLEDYTGLGVSGKLSLEKTFIELEESLNTGELPFGVYDATTLASYSIPSDIFIRSNGMLTDEDDGDFIVYDTAVDENDQIILEDGTDLDRYINNINSGILIASGFSGATTFDGTITWDILKV